MTNNFSILFIIFISLIIAGCSSSLSSQFCVYPENPYNDGGGHDAGRKRGESGKSCGGNSSSFINGCEEYYEAMDEYEMCKNRE